jgi:5'-methylthioadenosine phosphorylase
MKIGVVSGKFIEDIIKNPEKINVETNYGNVLIEVGKRKNNTIFFINRHGEKSNIPPHKINYLANLQAFAASHIDCIIALGTVGSMKKEIQPGEFVIPHDFIDNTRLRKQTFFDKNRIHIDMTKPYCPNLRNILFDAAKRINGIKCHENGVYLTTEGPRLESASEIKMFSKYAEIVGMTGCPEIVLAREKGICYASLCIVCNMAAGLQDKLDLDEISNIYSEKKSIISKIFQLTIDAIKERKDCNCNSDLSKASL